MNGTHIISTTDPINGLDLIDLNQRPHLVEGDGINDLTVYFYSKATRQTYLDIPVEHPEQGLSRTLSNPTDTYSS